MFYVHSPYVLCSRFTIHMIYVMSYVLCSQSLCPMFYVHSPYVQFTVPMFYVHSPYVLCSMFTVPAHSPYVLYSMFTVPSYIHTGRINPLWHDAHLISKNSLTHNTVNIGHKNSRLLLYNNGCIF
jgi:hypothetical protein